jgi:uncharacterized membrane protein
MIRMVTPPQVSDFRADAAVPPASDPPLPPPHPAARRITDRLGELRALDPVVRTLKNVMGAPMQTEPVRNVLSGDWMGHALHPLMTDVVIGSWMSATVVDVVGGSRGEQAADRLAGLGVLSAFPTIAAGWHDWTKVAERDAAGARIGLLHAVSNAAGLALWTSSLKARRAGERRRGAVLGAAGLGVVGLGGYLGGHLSYVHGARVETADAGLSEAARG